MREILGSISRLLGAQNPKRRPRDPSLSRIDLLAEFLPQGAVGAEIGVHLGDFSQELLTGLTPRELHLIDPWHFEGGRDYARASYGGKVSGKQQEMDARYRHVKERFAVEIEGGRVNVHRAPSEETLPAFPEGYFDWVYIDGNHLYDYVKSDIELCLKKVKAGGIISGDDYCRGGWWRGGVKKAVDEVVEAGKADLLVLHDVQFVLRVASRA